MRKADTGTKLTSIDSHKIYWANVISKFHFDLSEIEPHRKVWFTSDLHYFHKGAVKWRNLAGHNFDSLDDMHECFIEMWNNCVAECDLVVHVGDFSFGRVKVTESIIERLNGNILFVMGNHDYVLPKIKDAFIRHYLEFKYNKQLVCVFHYPILSWNSQDHGSIHLYGHMHGQMSKSFNLGRSMDVGYDANFKILLLQDCVNICNAKPILKRDHICNSKFKLYQWWLKLKNKIRNWKIGSSD